jgi:hypothetical protein
MTRRRLLPVVALALAATIAACSWAPPQGDNGDMTPLVVVDSTVNTTQPSTP